MGGELEEWRKHLTPELRAHFEHIGEDLVHEDVRIYSEDSKKWVALAWLAEKRMERVSRETRRFRLLLWVTVVGVIVAAFAAVFAYMAIPK